MARSLINSATGAAGWLRRGGLWTAVAGLAVLASGGVALAGTATSTPATAQITACYLPGSNPSALKVLHKAGSACPKADQTLVWNTTGPQGKQGPAGPQGAQGPQGPAGLSTGVSAGNLDHVPIDGGPNDPITVMTGPAVPDSGVYYVTGSLTIEVAQGDFVGCSFSPQASEPTNEEIGPATAVAFESMSLNGEISLNAGQSPSIVCVDANSSPTTQTGEGDLNAVLINSSTVGPGTTTPRHEPNIPLKIKRL
jgi:hypothetical protein